MTAPPGPRHDAIGIGLLGFGTVGVGAYRMLADNRDAIVRKIGREFEVVRIGIRDPSKPRIADASLLTTELEQVVDDPRVSIVVEVMGGLDPAGPLIERALRNGKH
ncbi:MAG: homoserine dehydrogenase, partial [Fimbriimonadaceae bacterium]|nr:homoserine dehydrogenase [Fimbriimonadaceae bacterium]